MDLGSLLHGELNCTGRVRLTIFLRISAGVAGALLFSCGSRQPLRQAFIRGASIIFRSETDVFISDGTG